MEKPKYDWKNFPVVCLSLNNGDNLIGSLVYDSSDFENLYNHLIELEKLLIQQTDQKITAMQEQYELDQIVRLYEPMRIVMVMGPDVNYCTYTVVDLPIDTETPIIDVPKSSICYRTTPQLSLVRQWSRAVERKEKIKEFNEQPEETRNKALIVARQLMEDPPTSLN